MDTRVTAWSLHTVLEGVAVAAQASAEVQESLFDWILSQDDDDQEGASVSQLLDSFTREKVNSDDSVTRLFKVTLAVSILREASREKRTLSEKQLDETWLLFKESLTDLDPKKLEFRVSRGAPGYLAIPVCSLLTSGKINELFRIHIWLPDHVRVREEVSIHSHQTDAQSWIVAGQMTNHKFIAEETDEPTLATNAEFSLRWSDGRYAGTSYKTFQQSSTARIGERLFIVKEVGADLQTRNTSYAMGAGEHHRPLAAEDQLCATMFYFDSRNGEHFVQDAPVIGPKDGRTENVQKRDAAPYKPPALVELVDAVRSWEKEHDVVRGATGEDEVVMAYYRLISAREHLRQTQDPQNVGWEASDLNKAAEHLNHPLCPPIVTLCKYPSDRHRAYLQYLLSPEANVSIEAPDEEGLTALDYAVKNGDSISERMIRDAIAARGSSSGDATDITALPFREKEVESTPSS